MTEEIQAEEDVYKLDKNEVAAICEAATGGEAALLAQLMAPLHAADIADLLEQVSDAERHDILHYYAADFDGEVRSEDVV